jgi:hypothetical protein
MLACLIFAAAPNVIASSTLSARTNDQGGVRVVVTPRPQTVNATTWEFDVALDTHTKPLTDDLAAVSSLVDDQGKSTPAKSWTGDPPGGHHRKGVLQFSAPTNNPAAFEVRVKGIGGVDVRTFRWDQRSQKLKFTPRGVSLLKCPLRVQKRACATQNATSALGQKQTCATREASSATGQ